MLLTCANSAYFSRKPSVVLASASTSYAAFNLRIASATPSYLMVLWAVVPRMLDQGLVKLPRLKLPVNPSGSRFRPFPKYWFKSIATPEFRLSGHSFPKDWAEADLVSH
mmetsp:Transcript_26308/g.65152  ORF Transcript_26308/g.65152 Transcript_26308/m.65152 type:complete len:109 (+) Transcript_26308:59-385(+)